MTTKADTSGVIREARRALRKVWTLIHNESGAYSPGERPRPDLDAALDAIEAAERSLEAARQSI